jgi:hypothetical protein
MPQKRSYGKYGTFFNRLIYSFLEGKQRELFFANLSTWDPGFQVKTILIIFVFAKIFEKYQESARR